MTKMRVHVKQAEMPATNPKGRATAKKHDVGLSRSERILVHTLRSIFDPKGKGKEVTPDTVGDLNRKGFVNPLNKRSVPRRKVSASIQKGEDVYIASTHASPSAGKAARARVKAELKKQLSEKVAVKRLSPSRLARTEKRAADRKEKSDKSRGIGAVNLYRFAPALDPKQRPKLKPISGVTPKTGVRELEVVEAFGGAGALDLLMRSSPKAFKHVVYQPFVSRDALTTPHDVSRAVAGRLPGGYASLKRVRDYTKATKGVTTPTTDKLLRAYRNGCAASSKPKEVEKVKSKVTKDKPKKKRVSPAQVRRKTLREEKRRSSSFVAAGVQTEKSEEVPQGASAPSIVLKDLIKESEKIIEEGKAKETDWKRGYKWTMLKVVLEDFGDAYDRLIEEKGVLDVDLPI